MQSLMVSDGKDDLMASTLKCPSCGGTLLTNEKNCPHCGAENAQYVEDTPRRIFHPKTIEELKEYCAERGMPLLRMRFFVGEDYREPKAFGIYKAGENRYVVYKNKADGSRAVRYDGPDEAYAVNELFEKLLSECHNRGIYPDGVAQRTSGSSVRSASPGSSSKSSKRVPLIILGVILSLFLLGTLTTTLREQKKINERIESLRRQPDTYDSVYIGKQYYTYDLESRTVVSSSSRNDHLNDGYYQGSYYVYPAKSGAYTSAASTISAGTNTAQSGAFYYRDGKSAWYVYISSECDWKPAEEPNYKRLGESLDYLGTVWQDSWNVPDYSSFPVKSGYYSHGEDCYYRDSYKSNGAWYAYRDSDRDWAASDCPVKLGVTAESLEYLGSSDKSLKTGIRSFSESSPYAIQNKIDGYYRLDDQVYYQFSKGLYTSGRSSWNYWQDPAKYTYFWYTYGQKPDPYIYAEPSSGEWYETSAPDTGSLVYLGNSYKPEWLEDWSVTDFKESAAGMQNYNINGYVKQEKDLYYHYKSSWYRFDSGSDSWEKSSEPAGDGLAEIFLGDSYQASTEAKIADEWEDDWHTTDFKTSDTWKSIERAEALEAARIAQEKEAAARKAEQQRKEKEERERYSYSSDYDSWDSSDTDWDSDW